MKRIKVFKYTIQNSYDIQAMPLPKTELGYVPSDAFRRPGETFWLVGWLVGWDVCVGTKCVGG